MTLQWISCDLRTGRVLADLPTLDCDWPLRRTIGQYDTATAHLHLDGAPENWERAIFEGAAILHAYDDTDPANPIQWSGIVTMQTRDTDSDAVDVSLATAEAYFDRRYVGDLDYFQSPQNLILADLLNRYIVDGTEPGLPMAFRSLDAGDGTLRDQTFRDTDNATVYSRAQALMGLQGGCEFTVEHAWATDREHILPTCFIGTRLGTAAPAGLDPLTTWAMPGCVSKATQVRDFSSGKGATKVTAYSSGQGSATPQSDPQYAAPSDRPTYEYRWNPSSAETDPLVLDQWAAQALSVLAPGAVALTLTAARNAAPQYGIDWFLGDDLGYSIGGTDDAGRDTVRQFPGGMKGVGRAIAYEITDTTVTPVLAQASVYTEAS